VEKMKGKKIFGIGAAVLLVTLAFSSTVYSRSENGSENEFDKEFIQAISEFVENNSEDLEKIGSFLLDVALDYNFGQPLPVMPPELEMITKDLMIKFQKIVINYYNFTKQSNYYGRCAYYRSNGSAQFLEDEGDTNNYTGHCWTFCKAMVGKICDIMQSVGFLTILIVTLFFAIIPVFGFIYAFILILVIIPNWFLIRGFFERYKNYPYGLKLFYFKRAGNILRIWDEIRDGEQSGDPEWNPEWDYPQIDWITLIRHND
jgi:hypothetical protein